MKRKCAICSSTVSKLVYHQRFVLPTKNFFHGGYDVVICKRCGFAYADNLPEQSFLDEYYRIMDKKKYILKRKLTSNTGKGQQIEEEFLFKQYKYSINNIKKYINKKSRIIDVGCYTGGLLSILKNEGYKNLLGLDPSPFAAKLAKKYHQIKVIPASIFDDIKIKKFDFIILTHVLEHIADLKLFISRLSAILSKNGMIYIEVPDANNFFLARDDSKQYIVDQKEPLMQFSVEHINYFTTVSLNNFMSVNGFEKVYLKPQLSVVSVIASVWKRKKIPFDSKIETSLKTYIKDSFTKLHKPLSIIKRLVIKQSKIIVWGAGLHTQQLLAISKLSKANIIFFVDSNPSYHGSKLINKSIFSPSKIEKFKDASILISSKYFQDEIIEQIKKTGYNNKIITLYE